MTEPLSYGGKIEKMQVKDNKSPLDAVMPFLSGNTLFFPAVILLAGVILWNGDELPQQSVSVIAIGVTSHISGEPASIRLPSANDCATSGSLHIFPISISISLAT